MPKKLNKKSRASSPVSLDGAGEDQQPGTYAQAVTSPAAAGESPNEVVLDCNQLEEVPANPEEMESSSEDDDPDPALQPHRKRAKNDTVHLTEANERKVAEWLEFEVPFIYTKGHRDYKDKKRIAAAFASMGASLVPPVTGPELKTWFNSVRTRYGRLTATKSGQAATTRRKTDREVWLLGLFEFLKPHIVRQRQPQVLGVPQQVCTNNN